MVAIIITSGGPRHVQSMTKNGNCTIHSCVHIAYLELPSQVWPWVLGTLPLVAAIRFSLPCYVGLMCSVYYRRYKALLGNVTNL